MTMFVAWIPMLDNDERPAADEMSTTFTTRATSQYWDGKQLLGKEVAKSLHLDDVAWDIYLFYPPGAVWTDAGLPPSPRVVVQGMGHVIATKGLLPARGDAQSLPPKARDRADIVGENADLGAVLATVSAKSWP